MPRHFVLTLAVFLAWSFGAGLLLLLVPAPTSLALALLAAGWLLYGFVLRSGQPDAPRRWATLRLRPLPAQALPWLAAATVLLLLLGHALTQVYIGLVPVPPENFAPFRALTGTPMGRLSVVLLAVVVAPLLEEMVFRGLLQRPLERRHGPAVAITVTAAIFGAVHLRAWIFPLLFFLGVAFGWAVYATRSLWAGVVLHAAHNAVSALSLGRPEALTPHPTLWQSGPTQEWWASLALLLVLLPAGVWLARRLQAASTRGPTRPRWAPPATAPRGA